MINEVDIDGDGRIDYDEFVASLKAERSFSLDSSEITLQIIDNLFADTNLKLFYFYYEILKLKNNKKFPVPGIEPGP